jgi:drug/metabolite transporter (DMT)-like permease
MKPKSIKRTNLKQEITFMLAGLSGICLYYLLENIALTYTLASNVSVIISISPFFTAILSHLFVNSDNKLQFNFFVGFIIAILGIIFINIDTFQLNINPLGNLLALLASFVWATYSILSKRITEFGYPIITATRRIFFYGIVFMLPLSLLLGLHVHFNTFMKPNNLINIIYLALGASALCFVTWNYSVKKLGAIKTSVYIYMVPVITVITSMIVLKEMITTKTIIGIILTLMGLIISEYRNKY